MNYAYKICIPNFQNIISVQLVKYNQKYDNIYFKSNYIR